MAAAEPEVEEIPPPALGEQSRLSLMIAAAEDVPVLVDLGAAVRPERPEETAAADVAAIPIISCVATWRSASLSSEVCLLETNVHTVIYVWEKL